MIPIIRNILNEAPKNLMNHDINMKIIRDEMIYRYEKECIDEYNNVRINASCEELRQNIQSIFSIDSQQYHAKKNQHNLEKAS
jgi:hypothetical protein